MTMAKVMGKRKERRDNMGCAPCSGRRRVRDGGRPNRSVRRDRPARRGPSAAPRETVPFLRRTRLLTRRRPWGRENRDGPRRGHATDPPAQGESLRNRYVLPATQNYYLGITQRIRSSRSCLGDNAYNAANASAAVTTRRRAATE